MRGGAGCSVIAHAPYRDLTFYPCHHILPIGADLKLLKLSLGH